MEYGNLLFHVLFKIVSQRSCCFVGLCSLSGGDDDAHGNQTVMETAFADGNAEWEITRYSGVDHGYTSWYSDAYNLVADARSWESMKTSFRELMAQPISSLSNVPTTEPCVEISREGVACPEEPIVSENGEDEDSGAVTRSSLSFLALAGTAVLSLVM
jgi:hypothetical protein